MASIWQGSIAFGLVEIPVVLQSAEKPDETASVMLDRRDRAPVGYRRYNKKTGKEVAWSNIVSGFESASGRYVVMTEDELKAVNPKATRSIDIVAFVDARTIEPVFFDKPYYLIPKKGSGKAYALLRETLLRTGRVGIAQVVIRTRQHLAAVLPRGPLLVLEILRYAHEIKKPESVAKAPAAARATAAEVQMAKKLVEGMTKPWKPERFRDAYRDELMAAVKKKARSKGAARIRAAAPPAEKSKIVDLMEVLKRSVEQSSGKRKRTVREPRRRRGRGA